MSCRKINSENLGLLASRQRMAEGYRDVMEKVYNFDLLLYDGYNAKRGTSSFKTAAGGEADRKNLVPRLAKRFGELVADTKPSKGMTGYHF